MTSQAHALPTIILIHEAWHTPVFYGHLIDVLHAANFNVACPHLPTCKPDPNNTAAYADDSSLIYSITFDLASEGHDILLLMHGLYGGILGTDIAGSLTKSLRTASGQPGGIVGLVYLAAAMPDAGHSWTDILSTCAPADRFTIPPTLAHANGTAALMEPSTALFAADAGAMETEHWCEHLVPCSARIADVHVDVAEPAWAACRSTYVVCAEDRLLPEAAQRAMVRAARAKGALVDVEVLPQAGHEVQIREPDRVVIALIAAAVKVREDAGDVGEEEIVGNVMDGAESPRLGRSATLPM